MIDLSKQKTFFEFGENRLFASFRDNFMIRIDLYGNYYMMFLDEEKEYWETACKIESLEHLEKEYNSRSNYLFEWK